ncbi:MAG: MarR family transcriptional regulator [Actinobacteria bacterium]|nr:MarR family transcriptional regulator [Actinomycetota bacterium]
MSGMSKDPFDDPRLTALGLFVEAHDGVLGELAAVHALYNLSGADAGVLMRLVRSPGRRLRMTDLAAQTALSTSGITRIVDRLERRGLVRRELSLDDRRSWLAVLTDTGHQCLRTELRPLLATIQRTLLDPLADAERDTFLQALRTLRDTLRPAAARVTPTGDLHAPGKPRRHPAE